MNIRLLRRDEIPLIWQIDRREGKSMGRNITICRAGHRAKCNITRTLQECYHRGRMFWGAFENEAVVGVSILESKLMGSRHGTLQLKFLNVNRDLCGQGLCRKLFNLGVV